MRTLALYADQAAMGRALATASELSDKPSLSRSQVFSEWQKRQVIAFCQT